MMVKATEIIDDSTPSDGHVILTSRWAKVDKQFARCQTNNLSKSLAMALMVLCLLLATGLMLYRLGNASLYGDELHSLIRASEPTIREVLLNERVRIPAYDVLLHFYLRLVAPQNDFLVRFPSTVFGVINVALMYILGATVFDRRCGLMGAFLLTLSHLHLELSRTARMYTLFLVWCLLILICIVRAVRTKRWHYWLGFTLSSALSVYSHEYGVITTLCACLFAGVSLLAQWVYKSAKARLGFSQLALSAILIVVLILPLWTVGQAYARREGADTRLFAPTIQWNRQTARFTAGTLSLGRVSVYPFLIAFVAGVVASWRHRRDWLLLATVGLGVPLLLFFNLRLMNYYRQRYLMFLLPASLLTAGWGAVQGVEWLSQRLAYWPYARRVGYAVILLLAIGLARPKLQDILSYEGTDWRGAGHYLNRHVRTGDVVLVDTSAFGGFDDAARPLKFLPVYFLADHKHCLLVRESGLGEAITPLRGEQHRVWGVLLTVYDSRKPVPEVWKAPDLVSFCNILIVSPDQKVTTVEDSAVIALKRMIQLQIRPEPRADLRAALAEVYLLKDRPVEAMAELQQALAVSPDRVAYQLLLARTHKRLGHADEMDAAYCQVLQLQQNNKEALRELKGKSLIDLLPSAKVQAPTKPFPHFEVTTFIMPAGNEKQTILMHPPARITYPLDLRQKTSALLRFSLAMDPETWEWGGDGSTFEVWVNDGEKDTPVFGKYVSNSSADHRWHDHLLELSPYAGRYIKLSFVTGPGPNNDFTGDRAGWGDPRLCLLPP